MIADSNVWDCGKGRDHLRMIKYTVRHIVQLFAQVDEEDLNLGGCPIEGSGERCHNDPLEALLELFCRKYQY
jgi:hypothetical protein